MSNGVTPADPRLFRKTLWNHWEEVLAGETGLLKSKLVKLRLVEQVIAATTTRARRAAMFTEKFITGLPEFTVVIPSLGAIKL